MKLSTSKIVLGATLALSVGAFTYSASASIPTTQGRANVNRNVGIQLAQATVGQKVDEKADEVKSEAVGAKNAVVAAHRKHERNERLHHTVGGKIDAKVGEVKNETTGAANAIDRAHENHEALEHSEGRD
jgi:hypothetical protein